MPVERNEHELVLTRTFNAPRELVYAAWTEPQHLDKWQGAPEGFTVTVEVSDIRTGGRFRIGMRSPQGQDHWLEGTYREVSPPEKLVFTHAWVDENGKSSPETLVTISFEARGEKTALTLHQTGFTSDGARDGHVEGWTSQLDRFTQYVDSL